MEEVSLQFECIDFSLDIDDVLSIEEDLTCITTLGLGFSSISQFMSNLWWLLSLRYRTILIHLIIMIWQMNCFFFILAVRKRLELSKTMDLGVLMASWWPSSNGSLMSLLVRSFSTIFQCGCRCGGFCLVGAQCLCNLAPE